MPFRINLAVFLFSAGFLKQKRRPFQTAFLFLV